MKPPPGMPAPYGRLEQLPLDSGFAQKHKGEPIACATQTGGNTSADCGCGVGLERCGERRLVHRLLRGEALGLAAALPVEGFPHHVLEGEDGESVRLDVAKYAAAPDATDAELLDRCTGPTLDIGCGPGRLSAELARRGIPSLGVDVAPVALLLARAAGATTLRRSVFDPLPGEGRWPHALLIDGNIGIGGDPAALLARIKALLQPAGGELVVEAAADDIDERHRLRVDGRGAALPWARLGTAALRAVAEPLGYTLAATWQSADRHFVALTT